jgi:hypothetical protein
MQNSTTLYQLVKAPLGRMERHYSEHLYTLETNDGEYASVYVDNKQIAKYGGHGAWLYAQRHASMLALNLDMGDL